MVGHFISGAKLGVLAITIGAMTAGSTVSLQAVPLGLSRGMKIFHPEGEMAKVPKGWTQFCRERPQDCRVEAHEPRLPELTEIRFQELERVNHDVNRSVKPRTDLRNYGVSEKWAYPDNGYGDCEDYVLQKRRKLIELGWPREALLITVVWSGNEGHSVLTAHTDKGDYVLDNQSQKVLLWTKTRYDYVKRQSRYNQNQWVYIDGQGSPSAIVVASAKRPAVVKVGVEKPAADQPAPAVEKQRTAFLDLEKRSDPLAGPGLGDSLAIAFW